MGLAPRAGWQRVGGKSKGEQLDVGGGLEWTSRSREDGVMNWGETEVAQKGA